MKSTHPLTYLAHLAGSVRPVSVRRGAPPLRPALPEDDRLCRLGVDELARPAPMYVLEPVVARLRETIGARPAETGGMLGGRRGSGLVEHVYLDETARVTGATYSPDTAMVNDVLRRAWNPRDINLLGFVHSHPRGHTTPSAPDVRYARRILAAIRELDRFLLPIAQSAPDCGAWSLHGHAVARRPASPRSPHVEPVEVAVLDPRPRPRLDADPEFSRVTQAYDLPAMASSRIVAIGVGGSASFLEDLARSGVGEFVLIDPDVVELPNIGTQQTYRRDAGRAKVTALGERLVALNAHVRVWTVQARLDELDDAAVQRLAEAPLPGGHPGPPGTTVLCGFTDDFWAQARVNRLALHLGLPQLQAQVYREGRGAELVFTVPGRTPACGRCALAARYRAFLEQDFTNDVTSHGTPLWATTRLNALKGPVIMAMLHTTSRAADPEHPATRRYRQLMDRIADRNLVQVRLDPDAGATLGLRLFDRVADGPEGHRLVTDEALWLPQLPDHPDHGRPACGDCGGGGDLNALVGRLPATALVPSPAA